MSRAICDADWSPRGRCECGRRKREAEEACRRCARLDGRTELERDLVHELRLCGTRASAFELAAAVGTSARSVRRVLAGLERQGRVSRVATDHDATEIVGLFDLRG